MNASIFIWLCQCFCLGLVAGGGHFAGYVPARRLCIGTHFFGTPTFVVSSRPGCSLLSIPIAYQMQRDDDSGSFPIDYQMQRDQDSTSIMFRHTFQRLQYRRHTSTAAISSSFFYLVSDCQFYLVSDRQMFVWFVYLPIIDLNLGGGGTNTVLGLEASVFFTIYNHYPFIAFHRQFSSFCV